MNRRQQLTFGFWSVQLLAFSVVALALSKDSALRGSMRQWRGAPAPAAVVLPSREQPLRIAPLYNRPDLVSDAELAAVLRQVRPKFPIQKLKPNYVEHALRIWGIDARFADPAVMSGTQMLDFLVNHGKYLASWGTALPPLLNEEPDGVSIRYGKMDGASVHHDHWLACLTEAGVSLRQPVYLPQQHTRTLNDVLQRALRDFRLDETETEWSALAFGLWLAPVPGWRTAEGRIITFDMLADRLLRGAGRFGVCNGTHRVYSMMALVRLDDEYHLLSPASRSRILAHLKNVRQLIIDSQFEDGHWSSNWYNGAAAKKTPLPDPLYQQVISTGHHLEWLAIAPTELHPPQESLSRAARWLIRTTVSQKPEAIQGSYTFFSHVGGALALWRNTRPAEFWSKWEAQHPADGAPQPAAPAITRPVPPGPATKSLPPASAAAS